MDHNEIPEILTKILRTLNVQKEEICCLNATMSGGELGTQTTVIGGIKKLTGTASFSTSSVLLGGTKYRSVSISVISLTTGTVTVTDGVGATTISYPGYSTTWGIDKGTDGGLTGLSIATTGDAIVIVSYTVIV